MSAARLTIVWYLVPALGAASWIATGLRGVRSRATRLVAILAAVAAVLSTLAIVRLVGFDQLGPGAWIALAGAVALVVGSGIVAPSRAGSDPSVRMADRGR
jgi:hypothetical protein